MRRWLSNTQQKRKESSAFGQVSLFDADEEASMETFVMEEVEDSTLLEKLDTEKTTFLDFMFRAIQWICSKKHGTVLLL